MNKDPSKNINPDMSDNNIFLKSVKNFTNLKGSINEPSFSLEIINGRIISKIDNDSNFINELTISNIGDKFVSYLKLMKLNNKKVLVASDGNLDSKVFSQIFASSLKSNNIKVFFNVNNETNNFAASFSNIDSTFNGMVFFSKPYEKKKILLISFFDHNGSLMTSEHALLFNENITKTMDLNLKAYDEKIDMIDSSNEKYLSTLGDLQDLSNIGVSINSSYDMNPKIINNFFSRFNIKYSKSTTTKPTANKNIKRAIFNSIKNKDDVAVSFLQDNNTFELAIKHKKQYKYLSLNDLTAIYLYYKIKYDNNEYEKIQNKYIVMSGSAGKLVSIVAKKNNIKVVKYDDFYSELSNNKDLQLGSLLATNGKNYLITKGQKNYISDPLYNLQLFLKIISFFKEQNKTLYDILVEINMVYGIYRHSVSEQYIDDLTARKLFHILTSEMKFADQKIIRLTKIDFKDNDIRGIKAIFIDKTEIEFIHLPKQDLLKIYFSSHIEKSQKENDQEELTSLEKNKNYINLIVREKMILESVKVFKDDQTKTKTSWKDYFKYFTFILIFFLIFIILFNTIYNIDGGPEVIFIKLNQLIMENKTLMHLIPLILLLFLVPTICNSILIGRMLRVQGQKVKTRHLVVSSMIGIVISNITPLSIGGDLAGYWYLRRKSFERGPLIATFLASSLLYQVVGAITSLIFIPIGFIAYGDILLNFSSPISITILSLSLIGFLGNVIGAIFIGIFSFSEKTQSFFIKIWISLIAWIPFIISRDPNSKAASFQYEFSKIRSSSLMIFQNIRLSLEFCFWRIVPFFINPAAFLAIASGMMKPNSDLWGGQYINFIIASSILQAANAISITPGGSGTSQFLQIEIFSKMFSNWEDNKMFSLLSTIMFSIIPTVVSALMLLTVWIGEKRLDKYDKIKRVLIYEDENQQNKSIRKYTRFYKIAFIIWILSLAIIFIGYYAIYMS
ncbi:MAG: flippase-like domain-containing protein [Mycoplasmataceae bacterium]|nr:flippase-like domain-containing protein [Mycoplasmataceae bacterium]